MNRRLSLFSVATFVLIGLLSHRTSTSHGSVIPKLCSFYIYYDVPDGAFERAALTEDRDFNGMFGITSRVVMKKVRTKQDFINAWNSIRQEAIARGEQIFFGSLYTHASKQLDQQDGLEFANDPNGNTLTRADIRALPKMPWAVVDNQRVGSLRLYGCNTGRVGEREWCPAQEFASTQGCDATGEAGYATFSRDQAKYEPTRPGELTTYLRAYRRGLNGITGDGSVIPPITFKP